MKSLKEKRRKYGDDLYEKLYMQQYNREKAPEAELTKPPAYPEAPRALNPPNLPEKIQPTQAPGKPQPGISDNKVENTFYTSKTNSGIIPNYLKSIQDFRGTIEDLDKRIADLNKQQFNTMLTGDGKRTAAFDSLIRNTESIRDSLKEQLARVMGIGSESADKDMLRKGGGNKTDPNPFSRLQFNADEPLQLKGLDDGENKKQVEPKPEPLTENNVFVSEEDFDQLNAQLDQVLKERYSTDGPAVTPIDVNMKRLTLEQNRELSKQAEEAQELYKTEEGAAVAFAEVAVFETGGDWLERGAIIIGREVPVVNASGQIVMETRYELGDTFIGKHDNVIEGLVSAYSDVIEDMTLEGATVSFVHTHPYCSGHVANEFSGLKGNTIWAIAGEAIDNIFNGEDFSDFGHYFGDLQATWLPGVDRMYLASPIDQKLYACDDNGPIMDPNNPNKYKTMGVFKAKIYGPPHKD